MAIRHFCDGCGEVLDGGVGVNGEALVVAGYGLRRELRIGRGLNFVQLELCEPCLERAVTAVAAAMIRAPGGAAGSGGLVGAAIVAAVDRDRWRSHLGMASASAGEEGQSP